MKNISFNDVLLFLLIFLPGHLMNWWLERIFIVMVFVFTIFIFAYSKYKQPKLNYILIGLLLNFTFILTLFSNLSENTYVIRDYFELLRPLILCFFMFYFSLNINKISLEKVLVLHKLLLLYVAFVYFTLNFELPYLSSLFLSLYDGTKTVVSGSWVRVASPFENPNFLSYVLVLGFILQIADFKNHIKCCFWIVLSFFCVYLTGSRMGWFVIAMGVLLLSLKYNVRFFLIVVFLISIFIFWIYNNDIYFNISRLDMLVKVIKGGFLSDANFMGRVMQYFNILPSLLDKPFLGSGPSKSYEVFDIVDNQYLLILLRWGIAGLILYIMMFFMLFKEISGKKIEYFHLVFIFSFLVMLLLGAFIDNYRLFMITVIYYAAIGSNKLRYKKCVE